MPRLKVVYEDYLHNFDGKIVLIETRYTELDRFYIKFDINQLPHLVGVDKVYKLKAHEIVRKIACNDIAYKNLQHHSEFIHIKPRFSCYHILKEVFIEKSIEYCIYVSDEDSRNSMNLNVAFELRETKRQIILGLRKIATGVYIPVTLHQNKATKTSMNRSKRVKMTNLEFINAHL